MPSNPSSSNEGAWYTEWFDSPYYRLLYAHRSAAEARSFLDRLIEALNLRPPLRILDAGCGWGRHARYLAEQGFEVVGIDANPRLIEQVQKSSSPRLRFAVHDILFPLPPKLGGPFDLVLSLFTAFGYFTTWPAHLRALRHLYDGLRPRGLLVLDFMNTFRTLCQLVPAETVVRQSIRFDIRRTYAPPFLLKDIHITDGSERRTYRERIWAFWPESLESLLQSAGFDIVERWGDYDLSPFEETSSPRLIYLARKG